MGRVRRRKPPAPAPRSAAERAHGRRSASPCSTPGSPRRKAASRTTPTRWRSPPPTPTGGPSVRMVLLKGHGAGRLRLLHQRRQPQGRASSPPIRRPRCCSTGSRCAARCGSKGRSSAVSDDEADAYFASRAAIRSSAPGPRTSRARSTAARLFERALRGRCSDASRAATCRARRTGRASGSSRADRILDRPAAPAARAAPVHRAAGRRLDRRPALPMSARPCTHARPRRARDADQRAALASVAMALFLLVLKGWAAWATGSVAMLGSARRHRARPASPAWSPCSGCGSPPMPADRDHRFGHGKAEALAALVQVVLIAVSALGIAWRAVDRLIARRARPPRPSMASASRWSPSPRRFGAARLPAPRHPPHRLGRDRHRPCPLPVRPAAQPVGDRRAGARPVCSASPAPTRCSGWPSRCGCCWGAWRASSHAVDQLMDREWPEEKRAALPRRRRAPSRARTGFTTCAPAPAAPTISSSSTSGCPAMDRGRGARRDGRGRGRRCRRDFPATEILIHLDPEGHVDQPDNALVEPT